MKKIIITGGLGYLGTELCRLYSGISWKHNITVIDNRFLSERVKELKNWNIKFIQGAILDKSLITKELKDADVVHHLAGITDVAYVYNDINIERDNKIRQIAIEGTNNIINSINEECKLIFPSTHVVFEGFQELKKDIREDEKVCPILAYASSKVINEEEIKKKVKNYIILRLASVYGYSTDSLRISIMPNLFSKITSLNGDIKLFSGGRQLKSLVPLLDVVRCFKFMEESKIQNEIFHLSKESLTVKDVALICKKINPKVNIIETEDEIPNPGYSISNKKLLSTGFKFLYRLEESIKEMVEKWSSNNNRNLELEYIKRGEKEFIDLRGKISNYELSEPINLIGYIESKKGSIRANHYHPVQEQKCLLIKGQYISIYQDLLEKNAPKVTHVVNAGDLIVTRPNVAHTMVFTQDSIFLNLVRGEREHENYGITHTVSHKIVSDEDRDFLLKNYKLNCRCCESKNLKRVISLGYQPLANNLLNSSTDKDEVFPLEVNFCQDCYNCQLSYTVEAEKLFSHYLYLSSTGASFVDHFKEAAKSYINQFNLNKDSSQIIDVGSNDGIALKPFKDLGFKNILGIEPAKNLAEIANKSGIKTIQGFLNKDLIRKINERADLILASNVFAHVDDIKSMSDCFFSILKTNGVIIIEVQYLLNTLSDCTFDNIYHEHINYWSVLSLNNFFNKHDAKLFKVEKVNTHGGSIRVFVTKDKSKKTDKSVEDFINKEKELGLDKFKIYEEFSKKADQIKNNVNKNIAKIKINKKTIVGYGSPAKATTALNFYNISKEIDFIIEDNSLKQEKFLPGVKIPIKSKKFLKQKPDYLLVLAWNFFEDIKKNNKDLAKNIISIKDLENINFK
ncbi:MAG: NAD-dependent epimerase/dehydratase family protein [Proteobacteria bacterium]|nr:NAD-dependent epimerase/dehydratase family protein [Pseudomonadota bacterium]